MLALSTVCAPPDLPLDQAVASFRDLGARAVALHRPAAPAETPALARLARRIPIVAVFGHDPGADVGAPILVVEGGPAEEDREASLENLCRRLHALRPFRVALRTPGTAGHHPSPDEVALVREALGHVGYWHDAARGGDGYLDAAARFLAGASFDPLTGLDLPGLRAALPAGAPAVVACAPEDVAEAFARASGLWR